MSVRCVVGLQWGDEGKGRMIDVLTDSADVVVRYQGGNNAGHTVVIGPDTFKLHLIPTGILRPGKKSVIANGVVIDPASLLSEIEQLEEAGIGVAGNLLVSNRAHLVMPYHKAVEKIAEAAKGDSAVGTTGRGIGPCYADKAAYNGIRVCDLFDPDAFRRQVRMNLKLKRPLIEAFGVECPGEDEIVEDYLGYAGEIGPYVCDTVGYLNRAVNEGKEILLEGAQGSLLDVDLGTYPFVTASHSTACGVSSGTGIAPRKIAEVVGVIKPYTTRVGGGPFPTELLDETGLKIRERGKEYGATTGRPRRCGWFDAVAVRYSVILNGVDLISLTNLDVLSTFDKVAVCTEYRNNSEADGIFPASPEAIERCVPRLAWFEGWREEITGIRSYGDLPAGARKFVEAIEAYLGVPIMTVSVGPERNQVIFRER